MPTWPTDPPEASEIEIAIFGPGKGESSALHLGDGQWIIIDSCIDQRSGEVPVLSYLRGIGVAVEDAVSLVVATHAHADHISGISVIVEACSGAFFTCSQALGATEFLALIELDEIVSTGTVRSGVYAEYRKVWNVIKQRRRSDGLRPVKYASEQRVLLSRQSGAAADVISLSPSDEAFTRTLQTFGAAFPGAQRTRRLGSLDPNELAVAILVQNDEHAILLGADLTVGPQGCGWGAVLASFQPELKSSVFKVPHHGAPNAHHPDVWDKLLIDAPLAVLAPFRGGHEPRPSPEDVRRLSAHTPHLYATAAANAPAPTRATKNAAADLRTLARSVRDPWGSCGMVRARLRAGIPSWSLDMFGPALQLHPQ